MSSDFGAKAFGEVMQLGYVVEDIHSTALEWVERVGAGPFYVIDRQPFDNYFYRGEKVELELSIAFGYWGDMQVELIKPLNDARTFYTDALATGAGRLNHYATVVKDIDGLLQRNNLQDRVVQSGALASGIKFVYLEEYMPGGLHLELVEATEQALQGYAGMRAVARNWDGCDPVRSIMSLGEDLAQLQKAGQ